MTWEREISTAHWKKQPVGHGSSAAKCLELGAADIDEAVSAAASGGHINIIKQLEGCDECDFEFAMAEATAGGHFDIAKLCYA